jgi:carbamoyl-phosphate synthase small subunit
LKALIALEDGTHFTGEAFAGSGTAFGELVFNTAMTGYQEILTDPSYHGQIVTMTYPLIGNYGVNTEDVESARPAAAGLIVGECSRIPSNWRAARSLPEYLEQHGILGVHEVDTRAVTLHIRSLGAMKCAMSTEDLDPESLAEKARRWRGLIGVDIAQDVTARERYTWPGPHAAQAPFGVLERGARRAYDGFLPEGSESAYPFRIAVLDCGIKFNQLRLFQRLGCELEVFPIAADADEILEWTPDGFFISNGPGDPSAVEYAVSNIRKLIAQNVPTFGICYGHQLIGRALGGTTYKLKFGHHGANQPVQDLLTGKVEITSQNHGFCVDVDSFGDEPVEITHVNLNDRTCEGLRHRERPVFSVQYHPEACPGPHDSTYLFLRFLDGIRAARGGR